MLEKAKIISNQELAKDIYAMRIKTEIALKAKAGQFVEAEVPNFFLRRPISIASIDNDEITLIYKIVGEGTKAMSRMRDEISILGPLGNGFPMDFDDSSTLIIGGGIGVPPLYELSKQYQKMGKDVTVVLGFLNREQVILEEEFKALNIKTIITTDDGTYGYHGNVIKTIEDLGINNDFIMACGPMGMLKGLSNKYKRGYLSLEQRMACGVGACMGCVVEGSDHKAYRVCKDGPVFAIGEIIL